MLLSEGMVDMPPAYLHESPLMASTDKRSYNESEVVGNLQLEIQRLRWQLDLSFHKEARFMQWYGLADGMRVLEFGCGLFFSLMHTT